MRSAVLSQRFARQMASASPSKITFPLSTLHSYPKSRTSFATTASIPIGAVAISVYFFIVSPCLLKLFSFQDKSSPYTGELVFIILNVSGLTFCKPCFVPSYCKRLITSYSGGNHLSTESILSFSPLNSVKKVPLPKFGFLARGFTAFHSHHF